MVDVQEFSFAVFDGEADLFVGLSGVEEPQEIVIVELSLLVLI